MNRNISKKIFATLTALTVMSWLVGPGVAQGATVEELQAQIAALLAQLNSLQTQLSALQGGTSGTGACSGITFTRNLSQGMSGSDVKCLQAILNQSTDTQVAASGAGSPGNETTYFGSLTKAAVVKFQVKYAAAILTPVGLTAGTGFVGSSTRAKLNTMIGGVTPPPGAGQNKVSLAADTPAAASVAKGAKDVIFAKINFCAASTANTVSKIILKRGGIAADADLTVIKLYDGITQVGSSQALNTTSHKATFSSLNWTIPANSCKVLTVKATIATGATQGDTVKLAIDAAADITSTITLDGVFPISSNGMTIAGISAGTLEVATTTPSGGTIVAGATDQDILGFKFTASATEAVAIHSITIAQTGSAVPTDITNLKLMYGSTQIGSTVSALTSSGKATFDLSSSPFEILAGQSKSIKVRIDIGASTGIDSRTVDFEITDDTDVTAYGQNSGGIVPVYSDAEGSVWPQRGYNPTDIVLGTLVVAYSSEYSPSAQSYAKGSAQNSIIAFKFTAGANESIRITQIKLKEASNTADTDVSNITLYDAVTGTRLNNTDGDEISSASMVSGYVTFGSYTTGLDSPGLFDIPKGTTKYILVKGDVPSGASATNSVLGFIINNAQTDVKADGLSSKNDLSSTEITGNTQVPASGSEILHNIISKGTLTVQASANTPGAATYAGGTSNFEFAKFDFVSTGEDITVSQLDISFEAGSDRTATDTVASSSEINNLRIYDGDTLLATDDTISSGKFEFGPNLKVARNSTKTVKVIGDIPSTAAGNSYLTAQVVIDTDVTVTGDGSGQTINATAASWPVYGNLMTAGAPEVDVKAGSTPAAQTYVKNTTDAGFASLLLTASTTEDVKVTKIRISAFATDSSSYTDLGVLLEVPVSAYISELISNVKLFDGATQVGDTVTTLLSSTNFWYADFTGLNITIPQGTTKVINVKAKILNNTSSDYIYMGVASTSGDVVGTGIKSGTAATVTNAGDVIGKAMSLTASGALAFRDDPDMPASAEILESTTASLGKWKFTAAYEDIEIKKLVFDVFHSTTASDTTSVSGNPSTTDDFMANFSSSTEAGTSSFFFTASVNDGATTVCSFEWTEGDGGTPASTTASLIDELNSPASSTCASGTAANSYTWGINAELATSSSNQLILYATPTATYYSLEITDYDYVAAGGNAASNTADDLFLGLKYGGTETIGNRAGTNANISPGKVYLYDGDTLLASAPIDAVGDASTTNRVTFNLPSGSYIKITKDSSKTLTLKGEISDYVGAIEGSYIQFAIGTTTTDDPYMSYYIEARGSQSQTDLGFNYVVDAGSATTGVQYISNAMYIYATKPTVTLNAASPSGTQTPSSNGEVFRFDVANAAAGHTLTINAIRFTINSNTSTSPWDKTYKLYKSSDMSTVIGTGLSWNSATSSLTSGYVAIYPTSGNVLASGASATYVLKADTSEMSVQSTNERLTVSIQPDDFYFDDNQAANAQKKVLNLPVTGNTLTF